MQAAQNLVDAKKPAQRKLIHEDMAVGFIGAGRMAQAMARGLISTGKKPVRTGNTCGGDRGVNSHL